MERKQTHHAQRVHASKSQKALAPLDQTPKSQHSVFVWSGVGILSDYHHDCSCGYSNCISKPINAYYVRERDGFGAVAPPASADQNWRARMLSPEKLCSHSRRDKPDIAMMTMSVRLWHFLCPDHSKYVIQYVIRHLFLFSVIRHLFLFSYSRVCASPLTVARCIAPCGTLSHAASSVKRVGNALGWRLSSLSALLDGPSPVRRVHDKTHG